MTSGRGVNISCHGKVLVDDVDFTGRNLARCRGYFGFTQQAINDPRLAVPVRIIFGARETKDLVHSWPAQIAVNEKNPIALLSQRKRIIRAGETLSFVRHRAGEKRNFPLCLRAQKRERSS